MVSVKNNATYMKHLCTMKSARDETYVTSQSHAGSCMQYWSQMWFRLTSLKCLRENRYRNGNQTEKLFIQLSILPKVMWISKHNHKQSLRLKNNLNFIKFLNVSSFVVKDNLLLRLNERAPVKINKMIIQFSRFKMSLN